MAGFAAHAQTVGQFRYDSTKFLKVGGINFVIIDSIQRTSDTTLNKPLVINEGGVIRMAQYWPAGTGGGGGGIIELGDGYGLIKVNDSTYNLDTAFINSIISGGDTTIFKTTLDSTGQPHNRILFSRNQKVSSSPRLLFDSANSKVVINNANVSAGGPNNKLFVGGQATVTANLIVQSVPIANDTTTYKPMVIGSDGVLRQRTYYVTGSGGGGVTDTPLIRRIASDTSRYMMKNTVSSYWYIADEWGVYPNDSSKAFTNRDSLQRLINYIATTKKNSVIYFKEPVKYFFDGVMQDSTLNNALIVFPTIGITDTQYTITLKGFVRPTFSPSVYSTTPMPSATILKCNNGTGALGGGSFLGGGGSTISFVVPGLENIIVQVPPNPTISGVSFDHFTCTFIKDVVIMAGYSQDALNSVQPTHVNSYGYHQPLNSSGINQRVEGVLNIMGFYNGMNVGEGAMIDDVGLWSCRNGLVYDFAYGYSEIGRVIIGWCPYGIKVNNYHNIIIRAISNEHYNLTPSKWFQYVADLVDSTNRGIGHIEWATVEANVGTIHNFNKYLGDSIYTHELGTFPDSLNSALQWRDTTGGNIYRPSGNVGIGSNFIPTYLWHLKKNQNAPTDLAIENTTAGASAQSRTVYINDNTYAATGLYSSATSPLGQVLGNTFYHIADGNSGIAIGATNATGGFRVMTGGFTERFRVHANGAVSIGSYADSTTATLYVGGVTLTSGVYGGTSSGGDVVVYSTTHATRGSTIFDRWRMDSAGRFTNYGANNTVSYQQRTGTFLTQSYSLNNGFLSDNIYYNGSSWTRLATGYGSGFHFLNGQTVIHNINTGTGNFTQNPNFKVDYNGDFGFGTGVDLGAGSFTGATFRWVSGALRMSTYGAGTLTTDASGNVTATSDTRLKDNIRPMKYGLDIINKLEPITYSWNKKSGNETKGTYAGFSAQNVRSVFPLGTGVMPDGYLTLQDRAIMAAMVNAIKELSAEVERLKKLIIIK